jgi:hypothetical protein
LQRLASNLAVCLFSLTSTPEALSFIPRHYHPLQPRLPIIAAAPLVEHRDPKTAPAIVPLAEVAKRQRKHMMALCLLNPALAMWAVDAESLPSIKSRFAPVLADAAQAIVDEAMSAASSPERRVAPTEVKNILECIDRGVISFEGNRIRFANDPLRVCSLCAFARITEHGERT